MLKLKNINLIRTSSFYRSDSLKALLAQAIASPFKMLLESKKTEFFLKDINLEIVQGERIALLGKNGSGKSTLCRLMAAHLFPSSGNITCNFEVSLFSQVESTFFGELSGRENLDYLIRFLYSRDNNDERARLLSEAIHFSELGTAIDRRVETYSSGMYNRLAMALVLARHHDLLILDEMDSHVDLSFRNKVQEKMQKVIDSSNSVIVVSHTLDETINNCTRGIVLDNGKVVFDGNIQKAVRCYRLLNGGSVE